MKNTVVLYILAVAFLIISISMIAVGLTPPPTLQSTSDFKRNEFTADAAYDFDALEIWEAYGEFSGSDDSNENGIYYIAYYEDVDGQLVLFSVYLDNSAEWKEKAQSFDYMNDELTVDACFKSKKLSTLDDRMEEYYGEAVDYTVDYMREYGENPIDSGLHLEFVCDAPEEYEDAASQTPALIVGIVMLLLCVGMFFFARNLKKKMRKDELEAQRELEKYSGFSTAVRDEDYKGPEF